MAIQKIDESYVGVDGAAAMTGMSPWTWRRYAYEGKVSSVKLGTRLLISRSEIQRVIEANTRPRRMPHSKECA